MVPCHIHDGQRATTWLFIRLSVIIFNSFPGCWGFERKQLRCLRGTTRRETQTRRERTPADLAISYKLLRAVMSRQVARAAGQERFWFWVRWIMAHPWAIWTVDVRAQARARTLAKQKELEHSREVNWFTTSRHEAPPTSPPARQLTPHYSTSRPPNLCMLAREDMYQ